MRKSIIYLSLLLVLNIVGAIIINTFFEKYSTYNGWLNYVVIILLSCFYYLGAIPNKKILRLLMIPLIFLFVSLLIFILDIFIKDSIERMSEFVILFSGITNSLNEVVNISISQIKDDTFRIVSFYFYNSIGIGLFFLLLGLLVDIIDLKISGRKLRIQRIE